MYTSSSQSIQFTHSLTILSPQRGILLRVNPSSNDQSIEPVSFLPSVGAPPPKTQSTSLHSSLDHLVLTFSWSPSSTSQLIPFSVSTPPPLTLATIYLSLICWIKILPIAANNTMVTAFISSYLFFIYTFGIIHF